MAARLYRKLPEATRYTKQQLNTWRDFIWGITIGHARDWLAIHNLAPETHEGERSLRKACRIPCARGFSNRATTP